MVDFWNEEKEKKINKKKLVIIILLAILLITIITLVTIYNVSPDFREWVDVNILNKEISQESVATIDIEGENSKICAFNKNIGVLNKHKFTIYNSTGGIDTTLDIEITNPVFCTSNRFLAIGEKGGQKIYVLEDKKIAWEAQVEGEISQLHINKNGYVAAVISGTSYKTVINLFDNNGKSLFKKYLSSTRLADISISNDNRFLALAEVDTSGTVIQSNVKIISIEKAQSDPENSMIKTYAGAANDLITNIKYQNNNKLVCMYDNSIHIIENDNDEVLITNDEQKVIATSIDLNNNVVNVKEQSSGLFTADSIVSIISTDNKLIKTYTTDEVTKEIYAYENIIALNLGAEVEFINTDAWLVKRFISKQEITNVVISNSIAGIVYRDKVEIINL